MENSQDTTIIMQEEQSPVDENEVSWCGCLNLSCFKWTRYDTVKESGHRKWWDHKLNELKQFSEKVAGPKWKNFTRKMGGYCHKTRCRKNEFQYDSRSYALNFDDCDGGEGIGLLRSSRFVAPFDDDDDDRRGERSGIKFNQNM